jgi:hypothetical protein
LPCEQDFNAKVTPAFNLQDLRPLYAFLLSSSGKEGPLRFLTALYREFVELRPACYAYLDVSRMLETGRQIIFL